MSKKLRKGDKVVVIAGNDRGKTGGILLFKKDRVLVEGVNVRKKHMRKTQEQQQSQIIDIECPIHISNVMLFAGDKGVKLRTRTSKKGEREHFYLAGKKEELYRSAKKQAKKS